jgi:7-cyano-7-deazaguanine reductase
MKQAKKKNEIPTVESYTSKHARSGIDAHFPKIETWPNQYGSGYQIEIVMPEFTSVCPKTGLPDHGTLRLIYTPGKECLELKSLKMYTLAYRNVGIFQENVVNRFLKDVVESCHPVAAKVIGDFTPRGGISTVVTASYQARKAGKAP